MRLVKFIAISPTNYFCIEDLKINFLLILRDKFLLKSNTNVYRFIVNVYIIPTYFFLDVSFINKMIACKHPAMPFAKMTGISSLKNP